ncbi:MAG: hypothetical protein WCC49_14740 [Pantoea agglomerans]
MVEQIGRVVVYAEINGEVMQVVLPKDRAHILLKMMSSLSDSGKLEVMPAPGMAFFERPAKDKACL